MIRLEQVSIEFIRKNQADRQWSAVMQRALTRLWPWAEARQNGGPKQGAFQALNNVSLEIHPGQRWGVVGTNGAGKTTLLRVIAGIYRPSRGRVQVGGRVTALLGVNDGFKRELSGLENVRLSGLMLGMSRGEIESLIPRIVEFAELQDFIDQPLRTYSSGMAARLGFAVATATRPDVLLIDETLAVGDGAFRDRCERKIHQLFDGARIVGICSHNVKQIRRLCDKVVWLDRGCVRQIGDCQRVIDSYESFLNERSSSAPTPRMDRAA